MLDPTLETLATADLERTGLSKARSEAIRVLAQAVREGRISFNSISHPAAVTAQLSTTPGFSADAVQDVAMRALVYPDAFPVIGRDFARTVASDTPAELEQHTRI